MLRLDLGALLLALLLGALPGHIDAGSTNAAPGLGEASSPPNVLLIIADDLNTRIGPYAEPGLRMHTPHLDRLAREGVTFTRAYAQYPVCGPSRASILSGLYPETSGVTTNAFETGNHRVATPGLAAHPTLPGHFRQQGYYTARVSKVFHLGVPGGLERGETGSDDADSWDFAVNLMAPETLTEGHLETLSRGTHYGSNFARMIVPDGDEATQADVLAANQAIAILESRVGSRPEGATNRTRLKDDAPFFLAVGFVRPHVPLIAPERHFDRYPDDDAFLPVVPEGDLDDVPPEAARLSNLRRFQMSEAEQRKAVAAYHASVSFMDEQVGRLLDALDRLQIRKNTVVVFVSDHGFNLGEHTSWQKLSLWEESVRVPLIVSVPDAHADVDAGGFSGTRAPPEYRGAGTRQGGVVELLDLYPTLLDLAGLPYPTGPAVLQGVSLEPVLQGRSDSDVDDDDARGRASGTAGKEQPPVEPAISGDRAAYTITSGGGASIRTKDWRYNRWGEMAQGTNEELYFHVQDPQEYRNLVGDPDHRATLETIRARFEVARSDARSAGTRYGVGR